MKTIGINLVLCFYLDATQIQRENTHEIFKEETNDQENDFQQPSNRLNYLFRNISRHMEDMKLQDPTDTNCSSDSDNQSIVSLNEDTSSRERLPKELVVCHISNVVGCFCVKTNFFLPCFRFQFRIVSTLKIKIRI